MERITTWMRACRLLVTAMLMIVPMLLCAQSQTVDKETTLAPAVKPAPVVKSKTTSLQANAPAAAPLPNVLGPSAPVKLNGAQPSTAEPMQGAAFSTARRAPSGMQDPEDAQPAPTESNP